MQLITTGANRKIIETFLTFAVVQYTMTMVLF